MDKNLLRKYAEIIIKKGVNIQKNQLLVITAPVENYEIVEMISEIAYKEGARDVITNWNDERLDRVRYLQAPDDIFDEVPEWKKMFYLENVRKDAAYLKLSGSDPDILNGVEQDKIVRNSKAFGKALKEYRERLMANRNVWCVASAPTKAWAMKMFPGFSEDEAKDKLWEAIFKANRIDREDSFVAIEQHKENLKRSLDFLNSQGLKKLFYKNSLGTDLTIELSENHVWLGGSDFMDNGIEFMANLPTEEVFTLPKKDGVNGIVYSSKPFVYNGTLIEDFNITFKDGKVVKYDARNGKEALKSLVELDEGSCYLGEVALVPHESPISQMNILFYNTLFDENASCHLALGEAYPICIKGGENMTKEELEKEGVNSSIAHEDFMVGTEDLSIIGIDKEDKEVVVFENGNFVY
ncbi:MAG: aminopeptidase [Bacillota bacterium]|nr:aminopeptidase [Bacillota bacterium]